MPVLISDAPAKVRFYFDIARNVHDVGLKTFHGCINISYFYKINNSTNEMFQNNIGRQDMSYQQQALQIAKYIICQKVNNRKLLIDSAYEIGTLESVIVQEQAEYAPQKKISIKASM